MKWICDLVIFSSTHYVSMNSECGWWSLPGCLIAQSQSELTAIYMEGSAVWCLGSLALDILALAHPQTLH